MIFFYNRSSFKILINRQENILFHGSVIAYQERRGLSDPVHIFPFDISEKKVPKNVKYLNSEHYFTTDLYSPNRIRAFVQRDNQSNRNPGNLNLF